jgi:hypothetical protein
MHRGSLQRLLEALRAAEASGDAKAAAYLPTFLAWMRQQRMH